MAYDYLAALAPSVPSPPRTVGGMVLGWTGGVTIATGLGLVVGGASRWLAARRGDPLVYVTGDTDAVGLPHGLVPSSLVASALADARGRR